MLEIPAQTDGFTDQNRRVLVVDDDRLVLLTLTHALRQAGYEVIEADNGDDAILMVRSRRPVLALLDIRMQGISGFDVAQYLRDYGGVPFIFISAYADEAIRAQAHELGALACLAKPVDLANLIRHVERALSTVASSAASAAGRSEGEETLQPAPGGLEGPDLLPDGAALPLALGLLMQREQIDRQRAWVLLSERARAQNGDLQAAARRLIAEHERAIESRKTAPQASFRSTDLSAF